MWLRLREASAASPSYPIEVVALQPRLSSEADDGADGDARAIGGAAGIVESDVVDLWAQGEVWENADIHAAAKAVGEVIVGAAAVAKSDVAGAPQKLNKGS